MGYSIGVLNNIRNNASDEYQQRVPVATQENIATVGNAIQTYEPLYNEFCNALIHKIGKTILEQKLFKNKLAIFKSGTVLSQQDVEEIFIEMAKAEGSYDPTGPNPLGRRNPPDVKVLYHRQNRQDVYTITIGDVDFRRAFKSEATLDAFIRGLINSVYSGAAYDEWLHMKKLLSTYGHEEDMGGEMALVPDYARAYVYKPVVNGVEDMVAVAKGFVKAVRKLVNDLSFPSTNYNAAGVMTWSDPNDLVLLVNKDAVAEVDVEVLAKSFNMGKTDIQTQIVVMDDFGDLQKNDSMSWADADGVLGILCDKDFFRVFDTLSHFEGQRNAQGMFTNYFYHVWQILSLSRFKNAVVIYTTTRSSVA